MNRRISLDLARVIAILGVITIHVIHSVYAHTDFVGGMSWWFANVLNAISRVAVPFFIMMSGALILNKDESFHQSLRRAWNRIIFPLIIWSGIYFLLDWTLFNHPLDVKFYARNMVEGSVSILYFLFALAGLYIVAPVLRAYVLPTHATPKFFRQVLVGSFIVGVVLIYAQFLLFDRGNIWNFTSRWVPYLGYFLFGWWVTNRSPHKHEVWTWFIVYLCGFVQTLVLSYLSVMMLKHGYDALWQQRNTHLFDESLSPNIIFMSVSFFALIVSAETWLNKVVPQIKKVIHSIASASFGMYLVHLFVIQILDKRFYFEVLNVHDKLWWFLIKKDLLVIFISWIVVQVCLRLPAISWLFGATKSEKKADNSR